MRSLEKLLSVALLPLGWLLYGLSFFSPRDPGLAVFGVHTSSISGNVCALLESESKGIRKIFIARTRGQLAEAQARGYAARHLYSLRGIGVCLTAGNYVYSSYPSDISFWLSGGARLINVWHGTPIKKIERDVTTGYYSLRNRARWAYWIIAPYLLVKPHRLLVASPYEEQCFATAFGVSPDNLIRCFPPRLLALRDSPAAAGNIVLYAPTWRDDQSFSITRHLNFEVFADFLEQEDLRLYIKLHPADAQDVALTETSRITILPGNCDIYQHLGEARILVTDYSSLFFEALYVDKEAILFCPDQDEYFKNSRELYIDHSTIVGSEVARSQTALQALLAQAAQDKRRSTPLGYPYSPFDVEHLLLERLVDRSGVDTNGG